MAAANGQIAVERRMSAGPADFEAARELVQRTAMLLDDEKFDAWVDLFDAQGTYELSAYSTEIRRWMTWQLSDRDALKKMLEDVDEHVRDPARRRHIVGIPLVDLGGDHGRVRSHFSLFRTSPEGQSSLYMVGCYEDRIVKGSGSWLYAAHKVIVDTRMLDSFTHIPV
jgi:3-phenylpropionate/cinnamic acid dioxygenase small subunit